MPVQKQTKPTMYTSELEYDFGDPEVIEVVVSNGIVLRFREPDVDDLLRLNEIEKETEGNQIMQTIQTICLLHTPSESQSKITMKEAKKMRVQDLKKIGNAIAKLVSFAEDNDNKSDFRDDS